MKKHKRHRRYSSLTLLTFLVAALLGFLWQQARQVRLDKSLFAAVKAKKVQEVRSWLDKGADSDTVGALYYYSETTWQVLKRRFVSLWDRHIVGGQELLCTALYMAVYVDDDANEPITAASMAAERIDPESRAAIVQTLLEHGAHVDAGYGRNTPLMEALRNGYIRSAELLLPHGANVKAKNKNGKTTLMYCLCRERSLIKQLLAGGADIQARDTKGSTALHYACENDNAELAYQLLAHGEDSKAVSNKGETPWQIATAHGRHELLRLFLDRGVDVDWRDVNGATALLNAANTGDEKSVELLLQRGAQVNSADAEGYTPLMGACGMGSVHSARLLILKGADVNAHAKWGDTALACALNNEDNNVLQIVSLLLAHHARVDVQDHKHQTLLQLAHWNESSATPEIIRLLKQAGATE